MHGLLGALLLLLFLRGLFVGFFFLCYIESLDSLSHVFTIMYITSMAPWQNLALDFVGLNDLLLYKFNSNS